MRHLAKQPGKEVSPNGNHGAFFSCDLYTTENHWAKFQLYKEKKIPQITQFDRTMSINGQGKVWMAKDGYRGPEMSVKGFGWILRA